MLAAIAGMANLIRREQPIFFQGIARGFISAQFIERKTYEKPRNVMEFKGRSARLSMAGVGADRVGRYPAQS
jgi:hypothetical protein